MAEYMKLSQAERDDAFQKTSNEEAASARAESMWKRTEIFKHNEKRKEMSFMYYTQYTAFGIFAVANTIAAIYSPIQDCDEVYNFWEPTHYLDRGYGFETWEYSPDYAIRSWTYAALHATVAFFGRFGLLVATKTFQFYFVRFVLGLLCAGCEARLYAQISRTLNARIGLFFTMIMLSSPGMFHASVSYLPSTTTMYTTMLGTAAFMDWRGGSNLPQGIFWIGAGSILAWPFAGALIIPYLGEEILLAVYTGSWRDVGIRMLYGNTRATLVMIFQFGVEYLAYRKWVLVPFNIVKYNVLSAVNGKGPNIFGTEPWHFYPRNLILNFHFWFLLALLGLPLVYYQEFIVRRPATKQSYIRNITFTAPIYLWLAIFTIQPHKEERFMYPIYPLMALNAAVSIHVILMHLGTRDRNSLLSLIPAQVRFAFAATIAIGAIALGLLRVIGQVTAYDAPLTVYKPLHMRGATAPGDTVCLGKEWYRFPGSYHLPSGVKAKFVKSAFSGLMPGEFSEAGVGFGAFPGTWLVPPGMNDENKEDVGKYINIDHCTFLVDSSFPGTKPTVLEPDYIADQQTWERVHCESFLDVDRTPFLARTLWVPDWNIIPEEYRRQWGYYCLLRQRKRRSN